MNEGKKFEEDFKKSVPDELFYYRFKDGTAAWDGGNARFQAKNICDCMIMGFDVLWLIELKSFKGKSFPFGNIDTKNLDKMIEASNKVGSRVNSSVVFNFRDLEKTFIADCIDVKQFMESTDRKSIPLAWFEEDWHTFNQLTQIKKRTRYRYVLDLFK